MSFTPCRPSKPAIGSSRFPPTCTCPTFHRDIAMCRANWKPASADSCIGNSSFRPQPRLLSPLLEPLSDLYMRNPPDLTQAEPTAGRKTPESPEPNLNSANSQSAGTPNLTGMPYFKAARAGRIESIPADIQEPLL